MNELKMVLSAEPKATRWRKHACQPSRLVHARFSGPCRGTTGSSRTDSRAAAEGRSVSWARHHCSLQRQTFAADSGERQRAEHAHDRGVIHRPYPLALERSHGRRQIAETTNASCERTDRAILDRTMVDAGGGS